MFTFPITLFSRQQLGGVALPRSASFKSIRTIASENLNQSFTSNLRLDAIGSKWGSYYYWSLSNPDRIVIKVAGNYELTVNIPLIETDILLERTRIQVEVKVNGLRPIMNSDAYGIGRNAYIRNTNLHKESSIGFGILLESLNIDDYVTIEIKGLTSFVGALYPVNILDQASIMMWYYSNQTTNIYHGSSRLTTIGPNVNPAIATDMLWLDSIIGTYFSKPLSWMIEWGSEGTPAAPVKMFYNLPMSGNVARASAESRPKNSQHSYGYVAQQGYIRFSETSENSSSVHFAGFSISSTQYNQMEVTTEQGAEVGTLLVPSGETGELYLGVLPQSPLLVSPIFLAASNSLIVGTNWNPATPIAIAWENNIESLYYYDSDYFNHSTITNPDRIILLQKGDYMVYLNVPVSCTTLRTNERVRLTLDGVDIFGAISSSNFIRGATGHFAASTLMCFLVESKNESAILRATIQQEALDSPVVIPDLAAMISIEYLGNPGY